MLKKLTLLALAAMLMPAAHAYNARELLEDCQAAEAFYTQSKATDPYQSMRSARCIAYVAGFADGYGVSDYLAEKIGLQLNAFCLPRDPDLSFRLTRAVVIHLERIPPNSQASTATLVAGALAKAFPCTESLDPKK